MVVDPIWQRIHHPSLECSELELWVVQLQCDHPDVSGNKILKLRDSLKNAIADKKTGLLTLGGAFSNHLVATAAACAESGLKSIGLVRTDALDPTNPTLVACQKYGMHLIAVPREQYKKRQLSEWETNFTHQYPEYLYVPEGGTCEAAVEAVSEFAIEQTPQGLADLVISAVGSGGTLAGLIKGISLRGHPSKALGIAVVKDLSLKDKITQLTGQTFCPWQLEQALYLPNYGRVDATLWQFCQFMQQEHQLQLEPIYTGKALYSVFALAKEGKLGRRKRLVFFHTGGLQGLAGLRYRGLIP